jgi:putative transposase
MARPLRETAPGGVHHVTARGNNGRPIFLTDDERARFLAKVGSVSVKRGWSHLAYCLMSNHVHLVLQTPEADLSDGLRDILATHARTFNRDHGRTGHLFGERFHCVGVTRDDQVWAVLRYVARNPVKAGLVARPEEWKWGSYRFLFADGQAPASLDRDAALRFIHPNPEIALIELQRFVEGDAAGVQPAPAVRPRDVVGARLTNEGIAAAVALGYSQRRVAEDFGLSESTISHRLRRHREAVRR